MQPRSAPPRIRARSRSRWRAAPRVCQSSRTRLGMRRGAGYIGTDLVQVKGCSSSGGGTMWSRMHAPKLKVVASALAAAPHRSRTSHRAPPYPSRHAQPPSTQQPAWHLDAHGKHHVDDFEGSYCSSEPARAVVVHVWEPNGSLAAQHPMVEYTGQGGCSTML